MDGSEYVATISFDDIDHPEGGCTTHLTGLFLVELFKKGIQLADYPGLIRLNPSIPWKTRGNAATFVRLYIRDEDKALDLFELAISMVEDYVNGREEKDKGPGVVLTFGEVWRDPRLRSLYRKALGDVVTRDLIFKVLVDIGGRAWGGRGVIGATVSQAALAPGDPYTYELIAYRRPELWGSKRCVRGDKVWAVEAHLPSCVFNNYDIVNRVLTATPKGPDPILAGFRGTCPEYLKCYDVVLCEDPHFWVLYKSNQHTDIHLRYSSRVRYYEYVVVRGEVIEKPIILSGGHVAVKLKIGESEIVYVMFFRETGPLKEVSKALNNGDIIEVAGSVRPYSVVSGPVIAADKIKIVKLKDNKIKLNPRCPKCGYRMESDGKRLRCPKCGYRMEKRYLEVPTGRTLKTVIALVQEGRLRHLVASSVHHVLKVTKLPLTLKISSILSLSVNPPVIDPRVSCGTH